MIEVFFIMISRHVSRRLIGTTIYLRCGHSWHHQSLSLVSLSPSHLLLEAFVLIGVSPGTLTYSWLVLVALRIFSILPLLKYSAVVINIFIRGKLLESYSSRYHHDV